MSIDLSPLFPPRPTRLAQDLLRPFLQPGDWVIDATTGNGYDTLFLADAVGPSGRVLAFDIQEAALLSAKNRMGERTWVDFFHESHATMNQRTTPESVTAIMFNLGYLPGEDHQKTTESSETLDALEAATHLLKPRGILSVVCYPGHPAGALEAIAVETWMNELPSKRWRVARYCALGTLRPAPFLLLACKPSA